MVNPQIAPANPEQELSREMVIGISAPPTLMEKSKPKISEMMITINEIMPAACAEQREPAITRQVSAVRHKKLNKLCPLIITGCWEILRSSFAAAIMLPLKVTLPTTRANWLVNLLNNPSCV